ncbi:MAG: sulfur carrier protein ThiS [Muribaculaceae bacterium]
MNITINNNEREFNDGISLTEVIASIENMPTQGYAVAVNNEVVKADERDAYTLKNGDKVMIIRAFYGG